MTDDKINHALSADRFGYRLPNKKPGAGSHLRADSGEAALPRDPFAEATTEANKHRRTP